MNPETKFTNKVRKTWHQTYGDIKTYKHSDRFHGGVADVELIIPDGMTAWIEFKYIKKVAKKRKAGVTELQKIFLEEHHSCGIPSYVLIGTADGYALYHIDGFDGYVRACDIKPYSRICDVFHYIREVYSCGIQ